MLRALVCAEALSDGVPARAEVVKTWTDNGRTWHALLVNHADIPDAARHLEAGPWYMHLWDEQTDEIIVLFRDRTFRAQRSNPDSFKDIVIYGRGQGVPDDGFAFPTEWPE